MPAPTRTAFDWRNTVGKVVLLFVLFAPSIWMMTAIPPLWRDADAYNQVVQDPRVTTFWGHGAAYCYFVKIPLWLGEQGQRLSGFTAGSFSAQPSQPAITDTGVWLIIIIQHLALGGASYYFITLVARNFWTRMALAVIWASNALFYTFAHCIGSESLGLIFVVLLAAQTVRLVTEHSEVRWTSWYGFAVALLGCVLTRQINLALLALLPATFLMIRVISIFGRGSRERRTLRNTIAAIGIGVATVMVANFTLHQLARKTRLQPHSRLGYTFLWRLRFLDKMPVESRRALVRERADRTHSDDARRLFVLLEQMDAAGASFQDWNPFMQKAIPLFGGSLHWERLDAGLNQMARAFLFPPAPALLEVARSDFVLGLKQPVTEVSDYLFATTAYYFEHKDQMPGCETLASFRTRNADEILDFPRRYSYFHSLSWLTYHRAIVIWVVLLTTFSVSSFARTMDSAPEIALATAMMAMGLAIFAASCLLVDPQPRFRFPMWQFIFLSLFFLFGRAVDAFVQAPSRETKSAGQLFRPEP